MGKEAECCLTRLIDGDGTFNEVEFDNFIKQVKLEDRRPYAVVAIMGPLRSGKSTLLNCLFHTNFKEMDVSKGISQTTKGIWVSRCADDTVPLTIVMDLEGTKSRWRREDDIAFEKQSALFAFAVSDIVLINMRCDDIGRSNIALLKTVFQDMLRLLEPHKTILLFVLRDHHQRKARVDMLESALREDIQKIWDSVPKPEVYKLTPLSEFFDVQVEALPDYETSEEEFKNKVANLRQRFLHGGRLEAAHVLEFSSNAHDIWNAKIKPPDAHKKVHQPLKVLSNLRKIAALGIKHVDLMKDSIFHSLSSVTKGRESSAALIMELCKHYDQNRKGFQLNKKVFFSFCTKEVANIIGMEDKGISFEEYKTQNKLPTTFPPFVKKMANGSTITTKEMKDKLSTMKVEDDDAKQNFRRLMTFYLIEEVLLCNRNNKVQGSQWWMVSNLDACKSVNWAKETEDNLHKAMEEAKDWFERGATGQHLFIGAAPVLEAILYERIPIMRPSYWEDLGPIIQKWKPHRRDDKWMKDKFSKLPSTSILPCKHCSEAVNIEGDVQFVQDTILMKTGSEAEKDAVIEAATKTGSEAEDAVIEAAMTLSDFRNKFGANKLRGDGDEDPEYNNETNFDDRDPEVPEPATKTQTQQIKVVVPEEAHLDHETIAEPQSSAHDPVDFASTQLIPSCGQPVHQGDASLKEGASLKKVTSEEVEPTPHTTTHHQQTSTLTYKRKSSKRPPAQSLQAKQAPKKGMYTDCHDIVPIHQEELSSQPEHPSSPHFLSERGLELSVTVRMEEVEEEPIRQEASTVFVITDDEESTEIEGLKKEIIDLKMIIEERKEKEAKKRVE